MINATVKTIQRNQTNSSSGLQGEKTVAGFSLPSAGTVSTKGAGMTRKMFYELTGDFPENMFGEDWEEYIQEYLDEYNNEIYAMKYGRA